MKCLKNRGFILFSIVNSIFLAFQIAGFALARNPRLEWNLSFVLILVFGSVIPGTVLGVFVAWFLKHLREKKEAAIHKKYEDGWLVEGYRTLGDSMDKKVPPASLAWLIILVSYVPAFLAYYPGICAYDCYIQLDQIIYGSWNEHHPILHTLVIKAFWMLGETIGDVNVGIAFFGLFQLSCLSGSFAFCIHMIKKMGAGKAWYWVLTGFGALFPYNVFVGLSVTKAGLFAASFLPVLVLLLYFFYERRDSLRLKKEDILYILFLIPSVAFRNNARYPIMVLIAVFLIAAIVRMIAKKEVFYSYFRLFLTTLTGFIISMALVTTASQMLNAQQGDRREMLSVPVQQLARTADYHSEEMSSGDMDVINEFILDEAWRLYDPVISDPVKRHVNTWYALHFPKQTAETYLRLLKEYPSEYIDSFLANNAGYLYIGDRTCLTVYGDAPGHGFVQTDWADDMYAYGASHESLIPWLYNILEKMNSENILQRIPLIGMFFVPGYVLWCFIYFAVVCWYRKRDPLVISIVLAVLFIGTLLLGPTVQMRYIYPVWIFLPFLAAVVFGEKRVKSDS